ncbi:hypothetical protein QFW80_16740 [Luteimonas sp. M1R5S18]|uniref:Lipoprotein n=1 Tax=Luteimonas rhizosphaericola TaxID=3042024 RepID=A0ABT6JNS3_9GAMM|nr:hypothetical protein [Luteimonas rhizosphaericola]MDH5832167.1 hypothetical protein [Luteimonas rhizosphaericola]
MRSILAIASCLVLAACGRDLVQPDLPDAGTAVVPQVQVVERYIYVRVPAHLTAPEPIAEGPIAQCFEVAAKRRAALERANAKLQQCGAIQGTEVEP